MLLHNCIAPQDAIDWWTQLNATQRIEIKGLVVDFTGIKWSDYLVMFTPRERLNLIYDKLLYMGILIPSFD